MPEAPVQADAAPPDSIAARYARLLHRAVLSDDPLVVETALAEAAELGREMMRAEIPLEEVSEVHHEALVDLAQAHPQLTLPSIAHRVTAPLMEAYMAYSLSFREQLEHRTSVILNARIDQIRRLESIGTLAAGVAHEFNNILGSIIGFSELLTDEVDQTSPGGQYLQHILQASFRARDLTARLLTFARDMPEVREPVDVVPVAAETLELLRATLPVGIRLVLEPLVPQAWVMADASQIQQIIMNLCINAADAIQVRDGRIQVGIETRVESTPTEWLGEHWTEPPNDPPKTQVRLSVSDNGEGMTMETRARIFDPFFTTKAPGKGTGLGLSVIHGLVTSMGGTISLDSTPGLGTRFSIDLPALTGTFEPGALDENAREAPGPATKDDEP
ncbi:sensor histidine kinase [Halochromatium roseum]|uniref:sensor histidine kinase n=1 Tax=Halochromatium roseum TaxID=391920 RepID=UPI0019142A3A|nr:ATP-binding protein [Halochromatium roseum]MBK5941546.1 histidine kinase [Halochromatium roseum]